MKTLYEILALLKTTGIKDKFA